MSATAGTGPRTLPTAAQSERRQRVARTLTYSFLIAVAIVYIFPFVIAVVTAFKTEPNATGFYERMGARRVGERVSEWGRPLAVMSVPATEPATGARTAPRRR